MPSNILEGVLSTELRRMCQLGKLCYVKGCIQSLGNTQMCSAHYLHFHKTTRKKYNILNLVIFSAFADKTIC